MNKNTRQKGNEAEKVVANYLESTGFQILSRNYTNKGGEIDIIAREGDEIVFIEVKSSRSTIEPIEMITDKKKNRVLSTSQRWLIDNDLIGYKWRVDFVGLQYKGESLKKMQHIRNAIY